MSNLPISMLDQLLRQQEEIRVLRENNEKLQQQVKWMLDEVRKMKEEAND